MGIEESARPVRLSNVNCVYCGGDVSSQWTEEHVVGRRFVPKGFLENEWNVIARACDPCNGAKAKLEDDLSAISMAHSAADPAIVGELERKTKRSVSRATGKPVAKSTTENSIKGSQMPGVEVGFGFVGPPRAEPARVYQLATMQLRGLMFALLYDRESRQGRFVTHTPLIVLDTRRTDWGNIRARRFAELIGTWEVVQVVETARGYFRSSIRREPSSDMLGWALEWNQNFRIYGLLGEDTEARRIGESLPLLEMRQLGPNLRYRQEVILPEAEDTLFQLG